MTPHNAIHAPAPCTFVLFGATGDLTRRKIIPALFQLAQRKLMPERFIIVAFARRPKDDSQFRDDVCESLTEFAPDAAWTQEEWRHFSSRVYYIRGDLDDPAAYQELSERLGQLERSHHLPGSRLIYLATPPDQFAPIARQLGTAGLNKEAGAGAWVRLIVEKPFGVDLDTARDLNKELASIFSENQIYRIDHYLGKETVQNILVLRFANQIFEPLWNQKYIDSVRITVAETLGMEGRGPYFDHAGITRDIVQNHGLQVLTLVAMEPPTSLDADAIRDEKVKVLRSIRPFSPADCEQYTVRGQYAAGKAGGAAAGAPAYRDEPGVAADSNTETYAAFQFAVDNWRWAGVPFTMQAGKRLPERKTEIEIRFRAIPNVLFARLSCKAVPANRLTIRIQPDEGAWLEIGSKLPGPDMQVEPVRMDFRYGSSFNQPIPEAYERLLLDAIRGDASLYARNDEVEAAWSLITPVLHAWQNLSCPLFPNYPAGTWGPVAAQKLMAGEPISGHPAG